MINKSIIFISLFIVFGCDDITKRNDIPNKKLANEFGINSTELIYQYYQKFGFTDLCEDIRMVSIPKESGITSSKSKSDSGLLPTKISA